MIGPMSVSGSAGSPTLSSASAPARTNVNEIVRLTSMPMIAAASGSCEVARIDFPWRVDRTSQESRTSTGAVTRIAKKASHA